MLALEAKAAEGQATKAPITGIEIRRPVPQASSGVGISRKDRHRKIGKRERGGHVQLVACRSSGETYTAHVNRMPSDSEEKRKRAKYAVFVKVIYIV